MASFPVGLSETEVSNFYYKECLTSAEHWRNKASHNGFSTWWIPQCEGMSTSSWPHCVLTISFYSAGGSSDLHGAARPRRDNPGPAGAAGSTEADLAERRTFISTPLMGEDCPSTASRQRPDDDLAGILQSRFVPGLDCWLKSLPAPEYEMTPARDAWVYLRARRWVFWCRT